MKDLSDRFADQGTPPPVPPRDDDPLARLHAAAPQTPLEQPNGLSTWFAALRRRADVLTGFSAACAAAIVLWPHLFPAPLRIPPVAETTAQVATVTIRPLETDGVWAAPDWYGLFNAYQLETTLRDISIRCNYGLASDARVDRYLHARLEPDSRVAVFLADPGTCPRL